MKQVLYTLLLFIFSSTAFATIRTVSNNPSTIAQFNTIQAAVDAAADGDSIYIHGSPNIYSDFTQTDKRLSFFGPGWAPDKNLPLQAIIQNITLRNSTAAGSPSGSEFHGLIINSSMTITNFGGDQPVNNLVLRRCQFNGSLNMGSFGMNGFLAEGCIFYNTINPNASFTYENFLFQNNIFFFSVCCIGTQINGFNNSINVRFDHNLFYSSNNGGNNNVIIFSGSRFLTFTNNIFNQANVGGNVSFSTYTNNITNNATLNPANAASNATPWTVNSNVDGGGNISNTNPAMTAQAQVDAGNGSPLLDFTIAAGAANNSGADGKDLGLLFDAVGSLNWTNSRNSRLPRIFSMSITNPTVGAGTNLSVNVNAKTSN